jgi:hypothetical protein
MPIMVVDLHPKTASSFCNRLSDVPHSINSENLPCKLPAQQQR